MTATSLPSFDGSPITVGDRVLPIGWGDGVPLYLCNTAATVVGIARTRVRVRFDSATYGGRFPEFDAVNPRSLRRV